MTWPSTTNTPNTADTTTSRTERLLREGKERTEKAHELALHGFWRGAAYGLGGGILGSWLLNRSLTTFFGATFGSEHALYRYSHPKWQDHPPSDRIPLAQTIMDHRLAIFSTSVAVVATATAYRAFRNPNLSNSQRFMKVCLYGQMAGLVAIAAMAGIAAARSAVYDQNSNNYQYNGKNNSNSNSVEPSRPN